MDNFLKAAGVMPGSHEGREFNDTDVYKAIEGAAYSLRFHRDPELEAEIDRLASIIGAAQEDDGYLYTARTVDPDDVDPELEGPERWSNLRWSHELYCLGHFYEAAVAYHQATGKRELLDIALRSAELIQTVFGPDGKRDVPGHQEVEIGLAKLYRTTGDARWLELGRFFLDERGRHDSRSLYDGFGLDGYSQDHVPVTEQREAVGHAVRAGYQYAAMADLAALAGVEEYVPALEAIWSDVVGRKLYLTGGLGAHHEGESFGDAYELPNRTAYNETCAAIANVMWNHRMFLLSGHGKYIDVLLDSSRLPPPRRCTRRSLCRSRWADHGVWTETREGLAFPSNWIDGLAFMGTRLGATLRSSSTSTLLSARTRPWSSSSRCDGTLPRSKPRNRDVVVVLAARADGRLPAAARGDSPGTEHGVFVQRRHQPPCLRVHVAPQALGVQDVDKRVADGAVTAATGRSVVPERERLQGYQRAGRGRPLGDSVARSSSSRRTRRS